MHAVVDKVAEHESGSLANASACLKCPFKRGYVIAYKANDVAKRGIAARGEEYKLNSAAISVYYAIRFYQIDKLNIE